jgi:hypothetical protein
LAKRIVGDGFTIVDRSGDVLRSARNATERAIAAGTILVQTETKRLLNLKSGPTKTNPDFPPSEPGEPPAKRTGTLDRSIDSETVETRGEFIGRVGTNLKYGFWLELGTRRMAARPYLRPALTSQRKRILALLKRSFRSVR